MHPTILSPATSRGVGLATWFVWYLDTTGTHEVHAYAYVDAVNESEACARVRAMGVDTAIVRPQGDANAWNRSVARRYYAATTEGASV